MGYQRNIHLNIFIIYIIFAVCPCVVASAANRDVYRENKTSTDLTPPKVHPPTNSEGGILQDFTPVVLPKVVFPEKATPVPTPIPGVFPKDPSAAALFSVVVPGFGHVYSGEPLKGLFFAAAFGVSLYLSLDNFKLRSGAGSEVGASNETAGSLYGLGALAAYGFGIQDAYNSAKRYNRRHYLGVAFSLKPYPSAGIRCSF